MTLVCHSFITQQLVLVNSVHRQVGNDDVNSGIDIIDSKDETLKGLG